MGDEMLNKQDHISALREVICNMHQCGAAWLKTVHVHESCQGRILWSGDVEVFNLIQHPKAKRCYAWAHLEGSNDDKAHFVVVLEIPPVKDAITAVQAAIIAGSETSRS